MSNLGETCERRLWYRVNHPEWGEPLSPETRLKFAYGSVLEELLLYLAREAGHEVRGEQDELILHGVKGHRDAVIDGVLVDVKSASSASFDKFEVGITPNTDAFGYIAQLDGYAASAKDLVENTFGAWFVIDKVLGRILLAKRTYDTSTDWKRVIDGKRAAIAQSEPPPRAFRAEADGKSGNMKLGTKCSYCEFHQKCWPGLRTFLYSNGPRFLTVVRRLPEVYEAMPWSPTPEVLIQDIITND